MADCEEFPCTVGLDRQCPLCGGKMTRFGDSWSDGDEWIERGFSSQQCTKCGVPCKMWDSIEKKLGDLRDALKESTELLRTYGDNFLESLTHNEIESCRNQIAANERVLGGG